MAEICPDCRAGKQYLSHERVKPALLRPVWSVECERCGWEKTERGKL